MKNGRHQDGTRLFRWICPSCRTVLSVESAEHDDDDERGVDATGNFGYSARCPMCATVMVDEDVIAAWYTRREAKGSFTLEWSDFDQWRREQPRSAHDDQCEVYDRTDPVCGCGHDARIIRSTE